MVANVMPMFNNTDNAFRDQADIFVRACRGQCPPAATAGEGLTVMKLIDAVYASGKLGREVRV